MSDSQNLFSLARSKLQLSVGGKDKCSLHRWVLLKNSIVNSIPSSSSAPTDSPIANHLSDEPDEEVDSFMFPDAGKFVVASAAEVRAVETNWLDSLLEQLGDDDDEEFVPESETTLTPPPTTDEDDEHFLFSPSSSPLSSTDELPSYFSTVEPCPYAASTLNSSPGTPITVPSSHLYHKHNSSFTLLNDLSEFECFSVSGTTEEVSDDESDVPSTPSLSRSLTSLALIEADSFPLPEQLSSLQRMASDVLVDGEESYFYSFEPDPFPFRNYHHLNRTFNIHC